MKAGDKLFVFGKDPGVNATFRGIVDHPNHKGVRVRFVKDFGSNDMFANLEDMISPMKTKKQLKKTLKKCFPMGRKLDQVWINTRAWAAIKEGIDRGEERAVIGVWKEQHLF